MEYSRCPEARLTDLKSFTYNDFPRPHRPTIWSKFTEVHNCSQRPVQNRSLSKFRWRRRNVVRNVGVYHIYYLDKFSAENPG
jgi:hypothetical protein